jgi:uncharacterized protein YegL
MKTKTPILLLILFGLFACKSNDKLHRVCGNMGEGRCYAVAGVSKDLHGWESEEDLAEYRKHAGIGQCNIGVATCDQDGTIIACDGDIMPENYETCDTIDNDCDGMTDEGWDGDPLEAWYEDENVCSRKGICAEGHSVCIDGAYVCTVQPQEEVCDNVDNDCDGLKDEDLGSEALCFDDEFWKVTNGQCRAGVVRCIAGQMKCDGQVLPGPELCDEEDNDCNGVVDDTGDTLSTQYDIVFVIDNSGSMCDKIDAVATALYEYVDQFQGNTNFRWAIVSMSAETNRIVEVITDFTDISTVDSILLNMDCWGNSSEASLDAAKDLCNHDDGILELTWEPNAIPLLFMFTDEEAQSYWTPQSTQTEVTEACLLHGVLPFMWSQHPQDFQSMVEDANGIHFELVADWQAILDDLNSIIVTLCGV